MQHFQSVDCIVRAARNTKSVTTNQTKDSLEPAALINVAASIAARAHQGQTDKAGQPYITHPQRVAARAKLLAETEAPQLLPTVIAAAWLHDVLEDTDWTADDLLAHGITPQTVRVVEAVTKRPGEPVEIYAARIAAIPAAVLVKRADLDDNSDPERLSLLDPDTRARLGRKYAQFRERFTEALAVNRTVVRRGMDEESGGMWRQYLRLVSSLGSTSNVVGEFAERLVADLLDGTLLKNSQKSADIELPDHRLVQVKARVIRNGVPTTQLGVIRSWDFDLLAAVLFDSTGSVLRAVLMPVDAARQHAAKNELQNGWIVSTTRGFLDDLRAKDITVVLNTLLRGPGTSAGDFEPH
jgi:hypothetical protein